MYSPGLGFCRVDWPSEPLSVPPGAQDGTRMIENDAKSILYELLGSLGSEWSKMMLDWWILSVAWQPGFRMVENDAKLFDFECLLAARARNGRSLLLTECAREWSGKAERSQLLTGCTRERGGKAENVCF